MSPSPHPRSSRSASSSHSPSSQPGSPFLGPSSGIISQAGGAASLQPRTPEIMLLPGIPAAACTHPPALSPGKSLHFPGSPPIRGQKPGGLETRAPQRPGRF